MLRTARCPFRVRCREDAALLARARSGDRGAFDTWFDRYYAKLHTIALEHLASTQAAEHITQELLATALCDDGALRGCTGRLLNKLRARLAPGPSRTPGPSLAT